MLVFARMTRALLVAALLTATSAVASAGTYVSLGIGNTGVSDSTTANPFDENGRSLRLTVGHSFTPNLAVEGGVAGYNAIYRSYEPYDGREVFAAVRGSYPIDQGFGVFARLGVQRTYLSDGNMNNLPTYDGNGYLFGAGAEYNLLAALGPASALAHTSVWVDYNRNQSNVQIDDTKNSSRGIGVSMWTLGVTVGF